jgi:hypothetical protein
MPSIRPVMMDSHGNPGTAGRIIGVETVLALVVEVLTTVIVDTVVLSTVVVNELVVVTGGEDV